jgi:hypothetical protein
VSSQVVKRLRLVGHPLGAIKSTKRDLGDPPATVSSWYPPNSALLPYVDPSENFDKMLFAIRRLDHL